MSRMLGARRSSHASATCIGVAAKRSATSDSVAYCSGLKPPSGNISGTRFLGLVLIDNDGADLPRLRVRAQQMPVNAQVLQIAQTRPVYRHCARGPRNVGRYPKSFTVQVIVLGY